MSSIRLEIILGNQEVKFERRDYIMYYKIIPKYLLIFYTLDYNDCGDFRPTIRSSIPFFSKEEAEKYLDNFIKKSGLSDSDILVAIIPAEKG